MKFKFLAAMGVGILTNACVYTEPEESGLTVDRPYPTEAHVCQVATGLTGVQFESDRLHIACPTHERGAISDRKREGGVEIATVGKWVVMRMP